MLVDNALAQFYTLTNLNAVENNTVILDSIREPFSIRTLADKIDLSTDASSTIEPLPRIELVIFVLAPSVAVIILAGGCWPW